MSPATKAVTLSPAAIDATTAARERGRDRAPLTCAACRAPRTSRWAAPTVAAVASASAGAAALRRVRLRSVIGPLRGQGYVSAVHLGRVGRHAHRALS